MSTLLTIPGKSAPPAAAKVPSAITRLSLLDTAERLFAERGIDGTSVRDITKAAAANVSAVNYHFGGKDGLVEAVFFRRLAPLNDRRLTRLAAAVKQSGDAPVPLESILDSFIRPSVDELRTGGYSDHFLRLMGRCLQEPNPKLETFLVGVFAEVVSTFNPHFLRALPGLPERELFWRTSFMFGTLHHALYTWSRFETCQFASMAGMPHTARLTGEQLVRSLIRYATAGMRAPFDLTESLPS